MDPISTDTARLRVETDGTVTAFLATASGGQGVETTMAQVVAGELDLDVDDVRVVQGDTGATPYGRGHRRQRHRGHHRQRLPRGGDRTSW